VTCTRDFLTSQRPCHMDPSVRLVPLGVPSFIIGYELVALGKAITVFIALFVSTESLLFVQMTQLQRR